MNEAEMLKVITDMANKVDTAPIRSFDVMGTTVNAPVKYDEASALLLVFSISLEKAREILPSTKLVPVRFFGNRCLLEVTVFYYHGSPIGPYHEFTFSIPAISRGVLNVPVLPVLLETWYKSSGHYVFLMGASNEISRKHIDEIFPYPLHNADLNITLDRTDSMISGGIEDGGKNIFSFEMPSPTGHKLANKHFATYYVHDNKTFKVQLNTFSYHKYFLPSKQAKISLGDHTVATMLKDLDIRNKPILGIDFLKAIEIASLPSEV